MNWLPPPQDFRGRLAAAEGRAEGRPRGARRARPHPALLPRDAAARRRARPGAGRIRERPRARARARAGAAGAARQRHRRPPAARDPGRRPAPGPAHRRPCRRLRPVPPGAARSLAASRPSAPTRCSSPSPPATSSGRCPSPPRPRRRTRPSPRRSPTSGRCGRGPAASAGSAPSSSSRRFLDLEPPLFGGLDAAVPGAPARLVRRLNAALTDAAAAEGVLLLDLAGAAARDGLDAWHDPGRWLQAKMEIAPQAGPMYGELVARLLAAARGKSRKCLVLDLDNTLWGGVIGDDGLAGIVIGQGSGVGEAHLALQAWAKRLSERGIVLAVCSKNDPAIAEAAFDHPEMLLEARRLRRLRRQLDRQGDEPARHRQGAEPRPRCPRLRRRQPRRARAGARRAAAGRGARAAGRPRALRAHRSPRPATSRRWPSPPTTGPAPGSTRPTSSARASRPRSRAGLRRHGRLPRRARHDRRGRPGRRAEPRPRHPARQQDQPVQHHHPAPHRGRGGGARRKSRRADAPVPPARQVRRQRHRQRHAARTGRSRG